MDNQDYVHEKARAELALLGNRVRLSEARSTEEAAECIQREFFHVAFVDLRLGKQSGVGVMRSLRVLAPSCHIFLITRRLPDYAGEVLALLGPGFRFAGLVDKVSGPTEWFLPALRPLVAAWSERILEVSGISAVIDAILEKADRLDQEFIRSELINRLRRGPDAIGAELEYILVRIFGEIAAGVNQNAPHIDLRVLRRGLSSSVVVEAFPSMSMPMLDAIPGNRCVIKIGAANEIAIEAKKYDQVVRFGVTLEHRVELLSYTAADSLAAVCYSFAGGNDTKIDSFDDLLDSSSNDRWLSVLKELFSRDARNWYAVEMEVPSLRNFFRVELGSPLDKIFDQFEGWRDSLVNRVATAKMRSGALRIDADLVLPMPDKSILGAKGLTSEVRGCFIHGDMHGGNVLVAQTGRPCLIDFRNAGLGPRLLDFAALQASVRFAHVRQVARDRLPQESWPRRFDASLVADLGRSVYAERLLIAGRYSGDESWTSVVGVLDECRRDNFDECDGDEWLWTEFAYCLSMFRFVHMEWYRKVRLLAWLSALTERLTGSAD